MNILVTGSNGLIGANVSNYFLEREHQVFGLDNNSRKSFFGKEGSTALTKKQLNLFKNYHHFDIDIRDKDKIDRLFSTHTFDVVVHCAAQPSHDKAKNMIFEDFEINAQGTVNLLIAMQKHNPSANFIFTSTNKVYGDKPNSIPLVEKKLRYDYKDKSYAGVNESMSIDNALHSFFGASKTAADLYVQEFGKNFHSKTTVLRLGCVTGSMHASVKLHGFLSYLVKSILHKKKYEIIGHKGKQVRDQIDAYDVSTAIAAIIEKPNYGEVYNMGGGKSNNASILELIELISKKTAIKPVISYCDTPRLGDHICYISDITKFKKRYPDWKITKSINTIIDELIEYEHKHG